MADKYATARRKLAEGKQILRSAGNNPVLLNGALISIHAAFDEYLKASRPQTNNRIRDGAGRNNDLSEQLDQLQAKRIINGIDRGYLDWMRRMRNKAAHADPRYLTHRNVEQYAELIELVITRSASQITPRLAQRNNAQPRKQSAQAAGKRPSPIRQVRRSVSTSDIATPRPAEVSPPPPIHQPNTASKQHLSDLKFLEELILGK